MDKTISIAIIYSLICGVLSYFPPQFTLQSYNQALDHFNESNSNMTFQQRFIYQFANTTQTKPKFLFVMTGCEASLEELFGYSLWETENVKKYESVVLAIEHRYFGESFPFSTLETSLSEKNIKYLSIDQALADYSQLIRWFKKAHSIEDIPTMTYGGSYCGVMSAFMRMKYPSDVTASLASAAPIPMLVPGLIDQFAYYEAVSNDFQAVSQKCFDQAKDHFKALSQFGFSYNVSQNTFSLLTAVLQQVSAHIVVKDASAVFALLGYLKMQFQLMAIFDYPFPMMKNAAWPVNRTCDRFDQANQTLEDEIQQEQLQNQNSEIAIRKAKNLLLLTAMWNYNVSLNFSTKNTISNETIIDIETHRVLTENLPGQVGSMVWKYLTCTQYIQLLNSNGETDIFYYSVQTLEQLNEYCQKQFNFSVNFQPYWVSQYFNISKLSDFGQYSNILFSNGMLDPTSAGDVVDSIEEGKIVAINITEAAHGLDLFGQNVLDPIYVKNARIQEETTLINWLQKKQ